MNFFFIFHKSFKFFKNSLILELLFQELIQKNKKAKYLILLCNYFYINKVITEISKGKIENIYIVLYSFTFLQFIRYKSYSFPYFLIYQEFYLISF